MRTINIHAAKTQLSRLVDAAGAGAPSAEPRAFRNFDADLPDEVLDAFEGR